MIQYLKEEDWRIVEEGFDPELHQSSESIFSIGNGKFGQRANFEEDYSGEHLQGSYIAGVYYPDKTKVGWWKNGYPEYFAKVLNATNWIGLHISVDDELIDLAKIQCEDFIRILDMRKGLLERSFTAVLRTGKRVHLSFSRYCSMDDDETAAIELRMKADAQHRIKLVSYLNANVRNEDSNYDEVFWEQVDAEGEGAKGSLLSKTKKTAYYVGVGMSNEINNAAAPESNTREGEVSSVYSFEIEEGEEFVFHKYVGICSSLYHQPEEVMQAARDAAERIARKGFEKALEDHAQRWLEIWKMSDIQIEGDVAAQQGIRFNIFHLNQTYTGKDERLNIGPKGFTGEKYGGSTYWDTEAYCLPFYLNTHEQRVPRQLLVYRFKHLQKAIENAEKLGFKDGAALYPMVTMNGEECHNEWEITFEEIHRNGAIAYGIFNYIRHTGDRDYLAEYGVDVLVGIARFWQQRLNWSSAKKANVILGVTGPNEYENNVNNNWYTNYIAAWSLRYAAEACEWVREKHAGAWATKATELKVDESEWKDWLDAASKMYFPKLEHSKIFLQQDGFLDKEQVSVSDLKAEERPINQHWSWDRILRSIFIKQADTLQGMYFFEEDFDLATIKENFDYYEPKTVHESSLSPCVHCVLAAKLGYEEKAYEMYLRTSRLDLDDYNHEAHEGLHITSMAGTWLSIVEGFGGMRIRQNKLHFYPLLPKKWKAYSFHVLFRKAKLEVKVNNDGIEVINHSDQELQIVLFERELMLLSNGSVRCPFPALMEEK